MAYKIDVKKCLKCGLCVDNCPEGAITEKVSQRDGLTIRAARIVPERCTDCGVCVSEEYWCPAQAIFKA